MKIMHNSFLFKYIFVFFLTFLFTFCSENDKTIIKRKKFIEIYTYLNIYQELKIDREYYEELVNELMAKHQVTVKDIENTINFYKDNPMEWEKILSGMREKMKEIRSKIRDENRKKVEPQKRNISKDL